MGESIRNPRDGLLKHEAVFVARAMEQALHARDQANLDYGKAVESSGGDWAFDDPASQAAAQLAHIKDKNVQQLARLYHFVQTGEIRDYPEASLDTVEIGSRVKVLHGEQEATYDIFSHTIYGLTPPEGVMAISSNSPLGSAIIGKRPGEVIVWQSPDGRRSFEATVVDVDQTAQSEDYLDNETE